MGLQSLAHGCYLFDSASTPYLSLPVSHFYSVSVTIIVSLFVLVSAFFCVSVCLSALFSIPSHSSPSLPVSLFLCLSPSLPLSLSFSRPLSFFLSIPPPFLLFHCQAMAASGVEEEESDPLLQMLQETPSSSYNQPQVLLKPSYINLKWISLRFCRSNNLLYSK